MRPHVFHLVVIACMHMQQKLVLTADALWFL